MSDDDDDLRFETLFEAFIERERLRYLEICDSPTEDGFVAYALLKRAQLLQLLRALVWFDSEQWRDEHRDEFHADAWIEAAWRRYRATCDGRPTRKGFAGFVNTDPETQRAAISAAEQAGELDLDGPPATIM
jgi:hypothetical protein